MHGYTLNYEEQPAPADVEEVYTIVVEHCLAQVGDHWAGRVTIFARDEEHRILGGIYGFTDRGWLRIEILGVKPPWRGRGLGTQLLTAAEQLAIARGCHDAWLDTFSFSNLPFYQKRGYTIFGALERYPAEHTRYFVRKELSSE